MLRINADGTIPTDNPFFAHDDRQQPGDLGARPAQPVHLRLPARHGAGCSSTTSARTPGRRSTTASRARTTAGPTPRARPPTRASRSPLYAYQRTGGRLRDHRRRVLQPGDGAVPRRATSATTSSPTTAAAGSASSIPRPATPSPDFATGIAAPGRPARSATTAACTTSRAARAPILASSIEFTTAPGARSITTQPASQTVAPGSRRHVQRAARRARRRCRYQWQRNGANIAGATARDLHARRRPPGDNGARFRARRHQRRRQRARATKPSLTVTANQPPAGTITAARQRARSTARGRRDQLRRHRRPTPRTARCRPARSPGGSTSTTTRTSHPFIAADQRHDRAARSRSPRPARPSANVWYRIYLTVRDSAGLTHTTFTRRRCRARSS